MELDPHICLEEIMGIVGRWSWAEQVRRLSASSCPSCSSTAVHRTFVLVTLSSTAVETAIAQCTSRWAMTRGHRLNTSIVKFWRRSTTVSPVPVFSSGRFPRSSLHSLVPFRPLLPTLSPSLIGHLASVDVKQHESINVLRCQFSDILGDKPLRPMRRSMVQCSFTSTETTDPLRTLVWTDSPGRPPRLSHSFLFFVLLYVHRGEMAY